MCPCPVDVVASHHELDLSRVPAVTPHEEVAAARYHVAERQFTAVEQVADADVDADSCVADDDRPGTDVRQRSLPVSPAAQLPA